MRSYKCTIIITVITVAATVTTPSARGALNHEFWSLLGFTSPDSHNNPKEQVQHHHHFLNAETEAQRG